MVLFTEYCESSPILFCFALENLMRRLFCRLICSDLIQLCDILSKCRWFAKEETWIGEEEMNEWALKSKSKSAMYQVASLMLGYWPTDAAKNVERSFSSNLSRDQCSRTLESWRQGGLLDESLMLVVEKKEKEYWRIQKWLFLKAWKAMSVGEVLERYSMLRLDDCWEMLWQEEGKFFKNQK